MQNLTLSADGQTAVGTRWRGTSSGTVKTGRCPPGFVATGFKGRQGDVVDRINGIYCKDATKINGNADVYVAIDAGKWGGSEITKKCPAGSAISQMDTGDAQFAGKTRPVNVKFGCRKYNIDGSSSGTAEMRIGNGSSNWWAGQNPATQNWYVDALNVIADDFVAGMKIEARNFSKQLDARTDPIESAKCAVGTRTVNCNGISPGSADATMFMADYCGRPTNSPTAECKIWCKQYPQYCDAAVTEYCIVNPADPYCSCITSPAQGIAKCVDNTCLTSGYVPTNMFNVKCPDVVNCTVQAALANAGRAISQSIPIQQNCGNTTIDPTPGYDPVVTPPIISASGYSVQIIIVLLFFIAVVIFVAVMYYRRRR
jgi:hypothetical protein